MIYTNFFIQESVDFLRSVTIKNSFFAQQSKDLITSHLGIDDIEDHHVPYYINLTGEYSIFDTMMTVRSLDTEEVIAFTKENLELHPKTKHSYKIPSKYFFNLISRYPSQVDLIKNILYPVDDITKAINAKDFSLLVYADDILEENERHSILGRIHAFLDMFQTRWNITEFSYEQYFPMTQWAALWNYLHMLILTQRVANLKTPQVHSSQIWEYLKSKGLGDYRSILSKNQQLFLYKNINYLVRNRGKDSNLTILADVLLKNYGITLKSKQVVLNIEDTAATAKPNINIVSTDIRTNTTVDQDLVNGVESVYEIVRSEYLNDLEPKFNTDVVLDREKILSNSKSSVLPTKLVELKNIDQYSGEVQDYLKFIWLSTLSKQSYGKLNYSIQINPEESDVDILLSSGEALALIYYAIGRSFDPKTTLTSSSINDFIGWEIYVDGTYVELTESNKSDYVDVPNISIRPKSIPTSAFFYGIFKEDLSDAPSEFSYKGRTYSIDSVVDRDVMLESIKNDDGVISDKDELLDVLDTQYNTMISHFNTTKAIANTSRYFGTMTLYAGIQQNEERSINIGSGTYQDWFNRSTAITQLIEFLDSQNDTENTYAELANDLILQLIPLNESTNGIISGLTSSDFALMKQLFIQLCSYNITFLDSNVSRKSYVSSHPYTVDDRSNKEIHTTSMHPHPLYGSENHHEVSSIAELQLTLDVSDSRRSLVESESILSPGIAVSFKSEVIGHSSIKSKSTTNYNREIL